MCYESAISRGVSTGVVWMSAAVDVLTKLCVRRRCGLFPNYAGHYYYYYYYYYYYFLAHQHKACRQLKIKQEMTAVGD